MITVGAFTAYPHKYKLGGLRKMLLQQNDHLSTDGTLSRTTKLQRCVELGQLCYESKVCDRTTL